MFSLGTLAFIGILKTLSCAKDALSIVIRATGNFLKTPEDKTALKLGGTMLKDKRCN